MPEARSGGDKRGNWKDRAARKRWMLCEFGNGTTAPCHWCGTSLVYETVEADRYPVTGKEGGRYVRGNIVPACRRCNGRDVAQRFVDLARDIEAQFGLSPGVGAAMLRKALLSNEEPMRAVGP